MGDSTTARYAQYDTIRIGTEGVAEMEGRRSVLFIPREEVVSLQLRHTTPAQRPILTAVAGLALIAFSIVPIIMVLGLLEGKGRGTVEIHTFAMTGFFPLGGWLLSLIFRQRYVLAVTTPREVRKLVFQKSRNHAEIEEFLARGRADFSYL